MTATLGVKVVRFIAGGPSLPDELRSRWALALRPDQAVARAAGSGRPARVALAVPVDLPGLPPPRFAAIDIQWFADNAAALANDAWLSATDPQLCTGSSLLGAGSCQVVADEVVLRGGDYLATRWAQGGDRYKAMHFGRRNPALTRAEFSDRWRHQAGRLGDEEIPADVRGLAYIQNHPVPLAGYEPPLDAVNEVYMERADHLVRRASWFAARQEAALRTEAESFMSPTETWSMFVRESPLTSG